MYLQNNEWLGKLVSQIREHNHFHVFILRNLYHYRAVGACVARLILSFSLSVFDASTKLFCCSSDFLYIELFCHSYEKQNRNTLHSNSLSIYNYKKLEYLLHNICIVLNWNTFNGAGLSSVVLILLGFGALLCAGLDDTNVFIILFIMWNKEKILLLSTDGISSMIIFLITNL